MGFSDYAAGSARALKVDPDGTVNVYVTPGTNVVV